MVYIDSNRGTDTLYHYFLHRGSMTYQSRSERHNPIQLSKMFLFPPLPHGGPELEMVTKFALREMELAAFGNSPYWCSLLRNERV